MRTIVISPVVVSEDGDKALPFGTILLVLALRHIWHGQVVCPSRLQRIGGLVKLGSLGENQGRENVEVLIKLKPH